MMEKEALRVENACGRFLKLAVLDLSLIHI